MPGLRGASILDFENVPLLQVVHLFENQSHVVTKLLEFRHRHLNEKTKQFTDNVTQPRMMGITGEVCKKMTLFKVLTII